MTKKGLSFGLLGDLPFQVRTHLMNSEAKEMEVLVNLLLKNDLPQSNDQFV